MFVCQFELCISTPPLTSLWTSSQNNHKRKKTTEHLRYLAAGTFCLLHLLQDRVSKWVNVNLAAVCSVLPSLPSSLPGSRSTWSRGFGSLDVDSGTRWAFSDSALKGRTVQIGRPHTHQLTSIGKVITLNCNECKDGDFVQNRHLHSQNTHKATWRLRSCTPKSTTHCHHNGS